MNLDNMFLKIKIINAKIAMQLKKKCNDMR